MITLEQQAMTATETAPITLIDLENLALHLCNGDATLAELMVAIDSYSTQQRQPLKTEIDQLRAKLSGEARMFPMQNGPKIPWWLAEIIYAGYSAVYGKQQSLERLAERGGFGWSEIPVMYNDRRNGLFKQKMDRAAADRIKSLKATAAAETERGAGIGL